MFPSPRSFRYGLGLGFEGDGVFTLLDEEGRVVDLL